MTTLPAERLKLERRGRLAPGQFADVVVFDPYSVRDRATFESPHEYSEGIHHVLVNGSMVVNNGVPDWNTTRACYPVIGRLRECSEVG